MENYDVTALGELLIDFTENGMSGQGWGIKQHLLAKRAGTFSESS